MAPLACIKSPKEPCFIINILDIIQLRILEIKKIKISNEIKLIEIEKELNSLNNTLKESINDISIVINFKEELKKINLLLWDIEDKKRLAEKNNDFREGFIELARNVYKFNDERAKIKLKINDTLGSNIKEIKSYF